jgi:hypothetical protein
MAPQLPPPDPHESFGMAPDAPVSIDEPTVVFAAGSPSAEVDRTADAIIAFRPGALIVLVRD